MLYKYTNELFKGTAFEFYGIETAKVKELISNASLPPAGNTKTGFVLLLCDGSYLRLEFQITYNKNNIIRLAGNDLYLFKHHGRNIRTVIIYTANNAELHTGIRVGSLTYAPDKIIMSQYDGVAIYSELGLKIKTGVMLTKQDMVNLAFLPLMQSPMPNGEFAIKSISLAQTIPDKAKRSICTASIFTFAMKYLKTENINKLFEALGNVPF